MPRPSLRELLDKAGRGDADAQEQLGIVYAAGQGVTQDYRNAAEWFRKAADQGNANAQHNLGALYLKGRGVTQDSAEAVKWYRKAADQGLPIAQFFLGMCCMDGRGVAPDAAEAVKWYTKAADQGNDDAQFILGVCYASGDGVPQDYAEAAKWYRKAADQGNNEAQYNLGHAYLNGEGVAQDSAEAVKWFHKAADQGNDDAQTNLDALLELETRSEQSGWQAHYQAEMQRLLQSLKDSGCTVKEAEPSPTGRLTATFVPARREHPTSTQTDTTEKKENISNTPKAPKAPPTEPITKFEVYDDGTLREVGFPEAETREEFYESTTYFWEDSPADLAEAMNQCEPLAWEVRSIYSDIRKQLQAKIHSAEDQAGPDMVIMSALKAALKSMPEDPEEGVEGWLLGVDKEYFENVITKRINEWFSKEPDWSQEEDYLPKTQTAQGAALEYFQNMDGKSRERLGVEVIEGEGPWSTYYAANLRGDIEKANTAAESAGLPVRFVAHKD